MQSFGLVEETLMNREKKVDILTQHICNKSPEISPSECRATIRATNPLCYDYDTCRIERNSGEQLDYALSSIEDCVFLEACPGSGKTEVVGLKAAYEMSKWEKAAGGIAVLTFTNNAADVIGERVSQFFGGVGKIGFPHFIGTIDSWLHGFIAHPFAHIMTGYDGKDQDRSIRLVDTASAGGWLNAYKLNTTFMHRNGASMPLYANNIQWDPEEKRWDIFIPGSRNEPLPDCDYYVSPAFAQFRRDKDWLTLDYIRKDFSRKKRAFLSNGFATYQDVEQICHELLSNKIEIARLLSLRFPLIIVDECQDLSWIQMQILDKMRSQGSALHFIGDLNQAIYQFKKVVPQKVKKYTQKHEFKVLTLSNNYRNCQPIADLCDLLVANTYKVKSIHEGKQLESPCVCITFEKDDMMKLPLWFSHYLDKFEIDKESSAIITRSRANVRRINPGDSGGPKKYQESLAMAIHLWKAGFQQATGDALKFLGCFISEKFFEGELADSREYYQPESVDSALKWRLFLAAALSECCKDELLCDLEQTWKTWSQAVRDRLHKHLKMSASCLGADLSDYDFHPLVGNNKAGESSPVFVTPRDQSSEQVLMITPSNSSTQAALRTTTIHNVKGETLEALMLVSSRDKTGTNDGYWTQWLDDPASEAARLAYVASSRPRKLIVWAIPSPSSKEICYIDRLKAIGFNVLDLNPIVPKAQKNSNIGFSKI